MKTQRRTPTTNVRARPLPDSVRRFVERRADNLSSAYEAWQESDDDEFNEFADVETPKEFYDREKNIILDHDAYRWWVEESERTVACLGRTFEGDWIFDDRRGVVIKFQPWLGADSHSSNRSANVLALEAWEQAVEQGDDDLFATVYDYGEDASWIAAEFCTPIYPHGGSHTSPPYESLSDFEGNEYINPFIERFESRGWSGNYKNGNVGLADNGDVVLLDAGGHTSSSQ